MNAALATHIGLKLLRLTCSTSNRDAVAVLSVGLKSFPQPLFFKS